MKLSCAASLAVFSLVVALATACGSSSDGDGGGTATTTEKTSPGTSRTGETECRNGVGHCQAGQHCDSHGFTCETGCVTENNCPEGQACSNGDCVGGKAPASAPSGCTRMAGFDGQCTSSGLGKAYRCDAGDEPPHIACKAAANQDKYPGGVCCPF